MLVFNSSNHDVDLDSGQVLIPFGRGEIERSPRHDLMIADGLLTLADPPPAPASADRPGGVTRAPQTMAVQPDPAPAASDSDETSAAAPAAAAAPSSTPAAAPATSPSATSTTSTSKSEES